MTYNNPERCLNLMKISKRLLSPQQYEKYCNLTEWKSDEEVAKIALAMLTPEWLKEREEGIKRTYDLSQNTRR